METEPFLLTWKISGILEQSLNVELHAAICFSDGTKARVEGLRILHAKAGYVLARLGG